MNAMQKKSEHIGNSRRHSCRRFLTWLSTMDSRDSDPDASDNDRQNAIRFDPDAEFCNGKLTLTGETKTAALQLQFVCMR